MCFSSVLPQCLLFLLNFFQDIFFLKETKIQLLSCQSMQSHPSRSTHLHHLLIRWQLLKHKSKLYIIANYIFKSVHFFFFFLCAKKRVFLSTKCFMFVLQIYVSSSIIFLHLWSTKHLFNFKLLFYYITRYCATNFTMQ